MTIYRLTYDDAEEGRCLSFHSSRLGASGEFVRAQRRFPKRVSNCEVLAIEFQPTLKGILELLAQYCPAHDNG